jgi:hypothetical protein
MKYKLICIDMDGTLLSNEHEMPEENKEAIIKASELGVKVAITTGRLFTSARNYSDLIGIKAPIISSNGAYIREKDREEIIYKSTLTKEQMKRIYEVTKKYGLLTYFNTCDTVISEVEVPGDYGYKHSNKSLPEELRVKYIEGIKFTEIFDKYEGEILKAIALENVHKEKLEKAKAELRKYEDLEVVSSWDNNFEVMKAGTSKGNGVKHLAEMLGIKQEEIICIGDSENDISMIKYAGLGVAMGNAMDIVKEAADYVTDTNVNAGVAKVINKFVL